MLTNIFINGCSFLTYRPRDNVNTHCGIELAKLMNLDLAVNLANGGRGSKRLMWTTRVWCEKFPEQAEKCFFLIGSSGGNRFDYPTNDGYKKHKFPGFGSPPRVIFEKKQPAKPRRAFFENQKWLEITF